MIVSPDALRRDVVQLIKQIDAQINEVEQAAEEKGIEPQELRDQYGNWVMSPLLLAKVQAYSALIALNEPKKPR